MTESNHFEAKTICLVLTRRMFGNSKGVPLAQVEVEADKTLLKMQKQLLDAPELQAIQKHDSALTGYLKTIAFKSLFKGGVYRVALAMVQELDERLLDYMAKRQELVDAAVAAYPLRMQETAARLDAVGSMADYPSPERFRQSFGCEYNWVTFDTPTRLKAISAAIFESERQKSAAKLTAVAEECQQAMRAGLADLVAHLAERLTPGEDGKAKRLSHSTITNLNDFLNTFTMRNVTDDVELDGLVQQVRGVMEGVDHKVLKSDTLIAKKIAMDLTALKAAIDPLVIERGTRQISFEDEAEVA